MGAEVKTKTVILTCSAFEKELRHICGDQEIVLLPSFLHIYPAKLRKALTRSLHTLKKEYQRIVVVYGCCLPDMDQFLSDLSLSGLDIQRISGEHCLEIIGGDAFWKKIKEIPGTYFLTPGYAKSFRQGMIEGMGLDKNPRMKEILIRNYKRVVYFDTLVYGDMDATVQDIADYLGLPLHIERVGLSSFKQRLNEVLQQK